MIFEEVVREELYSFYTYRSLFVALWRSAPTVPAVESFTRVFEQMQGELVFATLVLKGVKLPSRDARAAFEHVIKSGEARTAGVAVFLQESGVAGTAIRGIMTAMKLVLRTPYPLSFVSTASEVATFSIKNWPKADLPAPAFTDLSIELARLIAAR